MKRLFCCLLALCLLLMPMALADNPLYAASIPADTRAIEEEAFCGDTGFTVAYLPDGLQRIEKRAFADTSLRVINLPSTLEYVAPDAFEGCFSTLLAIVEKGSAQHSMAIDLNQLKARSSTSLSLTCGLPDLSGAAGKTWPFLWMAASCSRKMGV